jgi:mannose-1-phosphate guanylyltransferase
MNNRYVIIMAGGVGSRFWPLSRREKPKQFLDILGRGETLLQQTFRRFKSICQEDHIFVVTSAEHTDMVIEQLGIDPSQVLGEPFRRNTAPCLAYGTFRILKENPDAVIAVTPADHLIIKEDKFSEALESCFDFAGGNDALVTLGIKPDRPETGYGYIQADQKKPVKGFMNLLKVKTFVESLFGERRFLLELGNLYLEHKINTFSI